jgi:hypothetical protein
VRCAAGRRSLSILALRYFDGLTSSLMPARRRCVGSVSPHPPHAGTDIQLWPSLAVRAPVSAVTAAHVVRSNRSSSFSGMKRVLEALR